MNRAIIMAQGGQTRLASLRHPKQLLPLRQCGTTIIGRTVEMLVARGPDIDVRVVGPVGEMVHLERLAPPHWQTQVIVGALQEPGNTVIKGLAQIPRSIDHGLGGRTFILLGDVVYSRAMLSMLLESTAEVMFGGTADLTSATGEVFGVSIAPAAAPRINALLQETVSPPFAEYQPGQLRRLLWQVQCDDKTDREVRRLGAAGLPSKKYFTSIPGDWTKDIDTEKELRTLLPVLDRKAWEEEQVSP